MMKRFATRVPEEPAQDLPPKVMVVDEQPDVLFSTQIILTRLGYATVGCSKAKEIVETAARERPDLILQDLIMPGLDVARTVKALRGDPRTASIPVVLFSAAPDLAQAAAEHDAAGYLPKPFGVSDLADLLDKTLGPRAAPRPPPMEPFADAAPARTSPNAALVNQKFHDYRNVLAAISNFVQFLASSPALPANEKRVAEELQRLVLDLEKRTEALQSDLTPSD